VAAFFFGEVRKHFFFEKKKQKTFATLVDAQGKFDACRSE